MDPEGFETLMYTLGGARRFSLISESSSSSNRKSWEGRGSRQESTEELETPGMWEFVEKEMIHVDPYVGSPWRFQYRSTCLGWSSRTLRVPLGTREERGDGSVTTSKTEGSGRDTRWVASVVPSTLPAEEGLSAPVSSHRPQLDDKGT